MPKLVLLTHSNICAAAASIRNVLELRATDRLISIMPLFHIHGLSAVFASLAAGASVICMDEFSPAAFWTSVDELHPTWYTAAPPIHEAILMEARRCGIRPTGFRFVRSASSAMPSRLRDDLEYFFGVPLIEAYGMTEAGPQIASNGLLPSQRRAGSVGRPAGPEVAIWDEAGTPTIGKIGEIAIRGANVMGSGEWFSTGDLGYLDADGFLFVVGRRKDIINRGGEKISPREVEIILLEHPAVSNALVFGAPHETLGETVHAAIVQRSGKTVTEAELRRFTANRLVPFKAPQRVFFVDEIPLTPLGKPDRMSAKLLLASLPALVHRRDQIQQRIAAIWASVLNIELPSLTSDFFHCGGHSLSAMQVVARLKEEFSLDLESDVLFDYPTLGELAELVFESLTAAERTNGTNSNHS